MAGMAEYGALLKQRREALGMTLDDVASQLGRPTPFVWRMEQGKNANPPDPETCRALWRVLGIPLRSQVEALGYIDPEEQEPGIAYAVPEGTPRAALLALLEDATDADVEAVTRIVDVSIGLVRVGHGRNIGERPNSTEGRNKPIRSA